MILGNLLLQIVVHLKEFPIVQWGFNRTSSITVFPISFNKTCIATYDNGSSTAVRWLDNVYVKLNGIQMSTSGFIAVGI